MAKKKKKQAGKQGDASTPKNKGPHDDRVQMGNLYAEEPTAELSPELTEAIDAAFDEAFVGEITNQVKAEIDAETTDKTAAALSGALSQQPKGGTSSLKALLRGGGSMVVAIVLMTLFAAVLGWATFVENAYGPNVSRFVVYRAWWFDVLLALLGVNVLCSMLVRLPWRRGHVPFVISHVGILILLIGCFVTSRHGIEAQLTVYEGDLGRFSQKTDGDEIGIEIIDFRKTEDEKQIASSSSAETSASVESVHERWTRERLASQHDRTKIKPVSARLQQELDVLGLNERLRFPVTLGPINWQDYEAENWFVPDRKFAYSLYYPLQTAQRSKGLVYDKDGIRVELLDYMADSRMKPAQQLKLRVQSINTKSDPVSQTAADSQASNANPVSDDAATSDRVTSGDDLASAKREIDMSTATTHELPLGVATDRTRNQDMYLVSLPYERISYRLAKSNAETKAFVEMANQTATGIWGTLVLRVGGQTHLFSVDELIKRQTQFGRSVNVAQAQQKAAEQAAISLRLQLLTPDEEIDADKIKKQLADKESELEELKTKLGELNEQIRMKIGETGLSLEMTVFRPDYLQMILVVTSEDKTPYIIALSADQPLASTVPDLLGMQIMHIFDPHAAKDDPMGQTSAMAIDRALKPRLDLLQGRDSKLYYRFWDGRKYSQAGEMPTDQSVTSLIGDDGSTLNVAVEAYEPHDYPGLKLVAEPYKKPESQGGMPIVSCVKVRVRIDSVGDETYWLQKTPYLVAATHLQEHRIGYVSGQNRTVAVTFPMAWFDLGFAIFLHKFERALEPGIGMPSYYASLVSVYPINDQKADTIDLGPLHDHVLIRMNQPGMFTDPQSGRKYRVFQSSYQGPYHPGMQRYEYETDMGGYTINHESRPRESVYASTLTANYDPGRGLKYLGCLMIVLGSLALFYTKKVRRKTGLTQLESMHGEYMTDGTEAAEMNRGNVLQSSISKRVLFGHVMFVAIGLIVAFSVAASAQDNVASEVATEAQAESPPSTQEATSEETSAETASEEDTPEEDGEKQVLEKPSTAEQSDKRESLPPENELPPMPEALDVSQMRVSSNVIDWRAWEELPVFYEGRVMPLATFARIVVTKVCGQSEPTFVLDEDVISAAERQELLGERDAARIRAKFANGPRRYRNSELVFSWLVEPEVWEYIPFLAAKNKDLRLAIEAKTNSSRFDGPKHISPYQIKTQAQELQRLIDQWQKLEAEKLDDFELEKIGEEGLDSLRKSGPAAVELQNSYLTYRMLTNEANALPEYQLYLMFVQADRQMQNAYRMQLTLERLPVDFEKLGHAIPFSERNELGLLYQEVNDLLTNFQRAMRDNSTKEAVGARTLEAIFEKLLNAFDERLPEVERFRDAMFALDPRDVPREAGLREGMIRMLRNQSELLCYSMHQSRQWCEAAYLAIYDSGSQRGRSSTVQIFPALVAESIKADRSYPVLSFDNEHSETGRMPTWLTLHTFLFGSDAMIRRFAIPGLPENTVAESDAMAQNMRLPDYDGTMLTLFARTTKEGNPHRVIRKSFYEMAAAYLALECYDLYATDDAKSEQSRRDSRADHIERFNRASLAFAGNLRANAEAVTELRRNLVPVELCDSDLLLKTAYPTRKLMRAEYHYERLQPFYLMWVTSAAALALLLISAIVSLFDRKRRRVEAFFFWAGFAVLIVSEIVTLVGACYRAYITGWAPVTNMFETVVLMAFSVVVIGIWYAFQPLFGERLMRAWRVAALPKGMPKSSRADDRRFFKLQVIAFVPRLILSVVVLYYVMLLSYGEAGDGRLTWQVVQNALAMNDPIDMGVVAVSIALITWLVPRALMTVVMFPLVGKADAPDTQKSASGNNTARVSLCHTLLNRKLFLIVGAALALAAGLAAYFGNATFSPNIRPLMAVLRSNFWLTVHVFAIIIGYAAGAIAWLLAVIACWHCIVGRWHSKRMPDGKYVPQIPASAEAVMPYIINMLRWTMLLIAIGTMLGARWADYSWGRFWSWDPKEVWALVTLLFYLIVLHGRAARYYGHFGTMLGALFGAIAIIMTWYGANVIFKGSRHAYGGADTSFETKVLLIFIAVNLVWGFWAMLRYMVQKIDAETQTYINRK